MAGTSSAASMLQVIPDGPVVYMAYLLTLCRSFLQVVSDGQFAALGLTLVAAVAKINALLRAPGSVGDVEVAAKAEELHAALVDTNSFPSEDMGQCVLRRPEASVNKADFGRVDEASSTPGAETEVNGMVVSPLNEDITHAAKAMNSREKRRRARQKALGTLNAIDALFSGIG